MLVNIVPCVPHVKLSFHDLHWWIDFLPFTAAPISHPGPSSSVLFCDSSDYAWGACFEGIKAQGHFTPDEKQNIIAVKELLAIYYGLRSFCHLFHDSHILVRSDSVGAVAYVRDMGGVQNIIMDDIACQIWDFAYSNKFWISVSFVPGVENSDADSASRILSSRTEWCLHTSIFNKLTSLFFMPTIDMFASRLNAKVAKYFSWIPDPYCWDVDAFSVKWNFNDIYLFPPFCLFHRCLQRVTADNVQRALIVFPHSTGSPVSSSY